MKHISYRPLLATLVFSVFIGCGQSKTSEVQTDPQGATPAPPFGQSNIPGLTDPGKDPKSNQSQIGSQAPSAPSVGAPSSQNPFAGLSSPTDNGQAPLSMPSGWDFKNLIPNATSIVPFVDLSNKTMFPNPDRFVPFFNRYYCSVFKAIGYVGQYDYKAALTTAYYFDVLGRLPEPAGLAHWISQLSNVESTEVRETVAKGIFLSDESARRIVDGLYLTALERQRGANEGLNWVELVKAGNIEDAAAGIYGSVEAFYKRRLGGGTSYGWVAYLYRKILGRTGYPWEYMAWARLRYQRNLANRVLTVKDILGSFEAQQKYVEGMYAGYLGRNAEPSGLQAWLNTLVTNTYSRAQVAIKFLSSPEYYDRAKTRFLVNPLNPYLLIQTQNWCDAL